jgi:Gas vesicle protein
MREVPGRERSERIRAEAAKKRARSIQRSKQRRERMTAARKRVLDQAAERRKATAEQRRSNLARARQDREVSLLDLVDRLLAGGVVVHGDITLAVADVDLVYVGLRAVIASVDSIEPHLGSALPSRDG